MRDWVCPLPSTRLRGADIGDRSLGHSSLVVSEEVYSRIVSILRAAPRDPERRDEENEAAAMAAVEEWADGTRGSRGLAR